MDVHATATAGYRAAFKTQLTMFIILLIRGRIFAVSYWERSK